jgi:TonB family protein
LRILSDDTRYPRAALDSGLGGSGTVNAKVSNAGVVVSATVGESTKSPILDEAMIKAAMTVEFYARSGSPDFTRTTIIPVDFLPGQQRIQEVPDPLNGASGLPPPGIANECGRLAPVALTPIVSAHAALRYPVASQAAGEQGIVRMKVTIDKNGYVGDAMIAQTSASRRLSEATLDFIKRYWHWVPPPAECRQTGVQLSIDQVWTLAPWYLQIYANDPRYPGAARGTPLGAWGTVRVNVSETGDMSDPRIQTSAGSSELDNSMMKAVMDLPTTPSIKDGKPQSAPAIFDVMFMPDSMQNSDTRPIPTRSRPGE